MWFGNVRSRAVVYRIAKFLRKHTIQRLVATTCHEVGIEMARLNSSTKIQTRTSYVMLLRLTHRSTQARVFFVHYVRPDFIPAGIGREKARHTYLCDAFNVTSCFTRKHQPRWCIVFQLLNKMESWSCCRVKKIIDKRKLVSFGWSFSLSVHPTNPSNDCFEICRPENETIVAIVHQIFLVGSRCFPS